MKKKAHHLFPGGRISPKKEKTPKNGNQQGSIIEIQRRGSSREKKIEEEKTIPATVKKKPARQRQKKIDRALAIVSTLAQKGACLRRRTPPNRPSVKKKKKKHTHKKDSSEAIRATGRRGARPSLKKGEGGSYREKRRNHAPR